ncbi:hypothetical protein D3Z48_15630, partial [Clostridiaceae bacterium]|nr:hypothetical protein [Clostridiaceae bacterium]
TGVLAGRASSPDGRSRRTGVLAPDGRQGSALHPLGLAPQTPEMLAHLYIACGRDGVFLWPSGRVRAA